MSRYSVIMRVSRFDFIVDRRVHFAAALGIQIVLGQQFAHALNGGQRRAHFVRDQRHHVVLGLLQIVLAGDIGKRRHDAQHRAARVFPFADRGHAQDVPPRARAADGDLALDGVAVDQQAGQRLFDRRRAAFGLGQALEQIAPDESLLIRCQICPPPAGSRT